MRLSGVLLVTINSAWPIFALFGGALYLVSSGREAAMMLSLKHDGFRVGPTRQHRLFFATYFIMAALGIVVVAYSAVAIWSAL